MQVHQFQPTPVNCSTGLVFSILAEWWPGRLL